MPNYSGKSGVPIGKTFITMSVPDKLLRLLSKPSILKPDQLAELLRIRALTKKAWFYHKKYINECYKEYYEKNI